MEWITTLVSGVRFKRFLASIILLITLFLIRGMLSVIFLTFVIGYIMANLQGIIIRSISPIGKLPEKFVLVLVYGLVLSCFAYLVYTYVPIIITQLEGIFRNMARFNLDAFGGKYLSYVEPLFKQFNVSAYLNDTAKSMLGNIKVLWDIPFQLIMAFLLSFLFLWEKKRITSFMNQFESSNVAFYYNFYMYLGRKFINSFGKMIQVQLMISTVNTMLTTTFLVFMGFPKVIGLAFLIFILGLIPVAGVVVSAIPLSILAFQVGGVKMILYTLITIVVVHGIESYILNPKLTSQKMRLPVFFTFFILLFGEHYLGMWGLLIGVPLVVFFLDLLEVGGKEKKEINI